MTVFEYGNKTYAVLKVENERIARDIAKYHEDKPLIIGNNIDQLKVTLENGAFHELIRMDYTSFKSIHKQYLLKLRILQVNMT